MIPAKRLYFLLLLGMGIAFISATITTNFISIIITLIYNLIIIIIALWDGLRVKSQLVKIQRQPLQKLSIGRDNPVILSITSQKHPAQILLKDGYPLEFKVSQAQFKLAIPCNTTKEIAYQIYPYARGEYEFGYIQVRQLSHWQLVWYHTKIKALEKVSVYPDLVGLRSLSIRLSIENTGTMRQSRRLSQGTEFSELREYQTGDDTRMMDWKATARRSRPVVRVLEPEREQTLIILLDRGRLMTAQVQGMKRFDWGLNATLSLALAGLNRGDRVGVGVFEREVTTWIPPEGGQKRLSHLIEKLTPIQPVLLEPDYVGAVTKIVNQQTRRALVVIITDIIDMTASGELLAALMKLSPRYLPFCVTLRDPLIDKMAHTPTETISTTYQRAVAIDLLAQRQVAFAKLRQKGVFVLDAPANSVSEELVDRYLQLKARNLL